MKYRVTGREVLYSLTGLALLLFWFLKAREYVAPLLASMPPWMAFLLYNTGFFFSIYLLLFALTGRAERLKISFIALTLFVGLDIIQPPYLVTTAGQVVTSIDFWYVSSDAVAGWIYANFLPASMVWFFTYVVTPALLLFVIPVLISDPSRIKKILYGK